MKRMKKLIGLLLAMVLCFGLSLTTLAATNYTIRISNEKSGHTYEAYQIFAGNLYEDAKTGEYGLTEITWGEGIEEARFLAALKAVTSDSKLYGLFNDSVEADDVAKVLEEYEDNDGVVRAFAALASDYLTDYSANVSRSTLVGDMYVYQMNLSEPGYYAIMDEFGTVGDGDAYTEVILQVVGANTDVVAKSAYPTVYKNVDKPDNYIGAEVNFEIVGSIPNISAYTTYEYIFSDHMSLGLSFIEDSLQVTADNQVLVEDEDYTLNVTYNRKTGTVIEVEILDAYAFQEESIVVTYSALLNEKAVLGDAGNDNTVTLVYSNNPNDCCTGEIKDAVKVFSYQLEGTKVDGEDNSVTLEGAEFVLKNAAGAYYNTDDNVITWVSSQDDATPIISDKNGLFTVSGLGAGTYYLVETKAPEGYNVLTEEITLVLGAEYYDHDEDGNQDEVAVLTLQIDDGEVVESNDADLADGIVKIAVENNSGSILPSTGGVGTKVFYVTGAVLMMAAAIVLITRKRVGQMD